MSPPPRRQTTCRMAYTGYKTLERDRAQANTLRLHIHRTGLGYMSYR